MVLQCWFDEKQLFAYAKTKTQISCAVSAQLISTFVFATQIVQSLFLPKFPASSFLLRLCRPVVSDLVGDPKDWHFSCVLSQVMVTGLLLMKADRMKCCCNFVTYTSINVTTCFTVISSGHRQNEPRSDVANAV